MVKKTAYHFCCQFAGRNQIHVAFITLQISTVEVGDRSLEWKIFGFHSYSQCH